MIVYISTFFPPSLSEKLQKVNRNFNPYSAHNLSFAIFEGLSKQLTAEALEVINVPPVGSYPRCTGLSRIPNVIEVVNDIPIKTVGFNTMYLYNYWSTPYNIYRSIKKYENVKDVVLLIYDLNIHAIRACKRVLKYNPTAKLVYIIPDMLEDVYHGTFKANLKMKFIGNPQELYKIASGFVLLTEQMTDKVGKTKPYCVVEGMYNMVEARRKQISHDNCVRRILYSGMLYEKFGVKNLLDAFHSIDDDRLRLQLCGCGDLVDYICELSVKDRRIEYLGMLPREKVLAYQEKADLLVNPRQPKEEFTKYSFPSKTIEYMVSGTPLLMYKLPGIPAEYYSYCFYLENNQLEISCLKEKLVEIMSKTQYELNKVGEMARDFIMREKNSIKQSEKILNLIKQL